MDDPFTIVENLLSRASKIYGPADFGGAILTVISCTSLFGMFCLEYWVRSDAEIFRFIQFLLPNATQSDFLLPLVILTSIISVPSIVLWWLMECNNRNHRIEMTKILNDALSSSDFIEYLNGLIEDVITKRIPRVRPYKDGMGRGIIAPTFASLMPDVVPAESVEEGKLAHMYRSIPKDSQLRLFDACPKIAELKIGVVQGSPLNAFSREEVR